MLIVVGKQVSDWRIHVLPQGKKPLAFNTADGILNTKILLLQTMFVKT
jgi:hypothetical protein